MHGVIVIVIGACVVLWSCVLGFFQGRSIDSYLDNAAPRVSVGFKQQGRVIEYGLELASCCLFSLGFRRILKADQIVQWLSDVSVCETNRGT